MQSIALQVVQKLKAVSGLPMEKWDACNFVDMPQGLMFHISKPKYKGRVYVKYEQCDTYLVQFGKIKKKVWIVEREEVLGHDLIELVGRGEVS